jgi:hypothetical protein
MAPPENRNATRTSMAPVSRAQTTKRTSMSPTAHAPSSSGPPPRIYQLILAPRNEIINLAPPGMSGGPPTRKI